MSEIENKCMHNYYRVCCERVHYTVVVLVYYIFTVPCSSLDGLRDNRSYHVYTQKEKTIHTLSLQKVPCMAHLV